MQKTFGRHILCTGTSVLVTANLLCTSTVCIIDTEYGFSAERGKIEEFLISNMYVLPTGSSLFLLQGSRFSFICISWARYFDLN